MRATKKQFPILLGFVVIGLGVWLLVRFYGAVPAPVVKDPVRVVKTALVRQQDMPIILSENGFVTAINSVDVRPQIQNVVHAIHVKEGQNVRAGDLLLSLDERGDASNLAKAQAQLSSNHADLGDAELILQRNQELLAKKFVSQAVVDSAKAKVDTLRAAVEAGRASLQASSVALGYNQIRAGISGRIGAISVHPGSLAQPSGTALLTIAQLDPIAVTFAVPEAELRHLISAYPDGAAPVTAQVGDLALQGKLVFIDNSADALSGTIRLKAEFANPKHQLWPGTYTQVQLVSRTLKDAMVLPVQAIVTGPSGKFAYVVGNDQRVAAQALSVLSIGQGQAAVSGLPAGTRVVMEGAENLRAGDKVREAAAPV